MSSASGFQRNGLVRAATAGKAFRRACTSGAITGKIDTPDRRQRRAVINQVTGTPSSASRKRAMALSFSWLSRTTSIGPRAANPPRTLSTSGSRGTDSCSASIWSKVRWSQPPTRSQAIAARVPPAQLVGQRGGDDRLSASPATDERQPGNAAGRDGSGQGRQLRSPPLEPDGRGEGERKARRKREARGTTGTGGHDPIYPAKRRRGKDALGEVGRREGACLRAVARHLLILSAL